MPRALEVHGLVKRFPAGLLRRREVLRGVDLELEAGATLGLLGPNGSGKSTLLRVLAGVERPDTGRVLLFGAPPEDRRARARVGFLAERTPFPRELSARAALDLFASLHALERRERRRRVEEALTRVGLAAHAERALGTYSQGMLRRFGLGHAFLARPDLVLLDEPTSGLDAPGHLVLEELLDEAGRRGAALVLASHRLADVARPGASCAVLVEGRVVARGELADVLDPRAGARLDLADLAASDVAAVGEEARRRGGRVVARGPSEAALVELYRTLEGAGREGGRR